MDINREVNKKCKYIFTVAGHDQLIGICWIKTAFVFASNMHKIQLFYP